MMAKFWQGASTWELQELEGVLLVRVPDFTFTVDARIVTQYIITSCDIRPQGCGPVLSFVNVFHSWHSTSILSYSMSMSS
jgi:hypothetical protein